MNRKQFLKTFAITLAGVALAPSFLDSCKKATSQGPTVDFTIDLSASANAPLNTVGGFIYSTGVIIARVSNADLGFVAVAQTCTHQGCTLNYNGNAQKFFCPCHNGAFDLGGNVVGGPPLTPVTKYKVTRNNNILTIQS